MFFALVSPALFAQQRIAVFEEPPASYEEIDTVSASSLEFSGNIRSSKKSYVVREMQRQAQVLGANAILITQMRAFEQLEPSYGRRPGSMQYQKIPQYRGKGLAIMVPEDVLQAMQQAQQAAATADDKK